MLIGGGMIDFRQARRTDYPEWVHDGLEVAQDNLYPNPVVLTTPRKPGNMYAAGTEIGFQDYTLYLRYDLLQEPILPDQDIRMGGGIALERTMGRTAVNIGFAQRRDQWQDVGDVVYKRAVAGAAYNLGAGATFGAALAWGEVEYPPLLHSDEPDSDFNNLDGAAFGAHIALSF